MRAARTDPVMSEIVLPPNPEPVPASARALRADRSRWLVLVALLAMCLIWVFAASVVHDLQIGYVPSR